VHVTDVDGLWRSIAVTGWRRDGGGANSILMDVTCLAGGGDAAISRASDPHLHRGIGGSERRNVRLQLWRRRRHLAESVWVGPHGLALPKNFPDEKQR
jgi:hypothetical protein